jgi:hypothetical protein
MTSGEADESSKGRTTICHSGWEDVSLSTHSSASFCCVKALERFAEIIPF